MSTKIHNLIKLAEEAGIELSQAQAAELIAKYPGKQARTIFKAEFTNPIAASSQAKAEPKTTAKASKSTSAAKPAKASKSTVTAKPATAKPAKASKTAATAKPAKAPKPTKATPASKSQACSLSSYKTLAEAREQALSPEPIVLEYLGGEKEFFAETREKIDWIKTEKDKLQLYRFLHPATDLDWGTEHYYKLYYECMTHKRDHLSPSEYFPDDPTDAATLEKIHKYHLTLKKLNAYLKGTSLKGDFFLPVYTEAELSKFGKKLFKDFDQKGIDLEKWLQREVKKATSYKDIQRKLSMAEQYLVQHMQGKLELTEQHRVDIFDDESFAYAMWMYHLLETKHLVGKNFQQHFREPAVPKGGWKKFKKAGHKLLFYFAQARVQDYDVGVLLAYSLETEAILDYVLVPDGGSFVRFFEDLCQRLKLTDFSFCGFFADNTVLAAHELKYLDTRGIEFLIKLCPYSISNQSYRNKFARLMAPLFEQIQPVSYEDSILVTAQALTSEEFDKANYQVNPDITWLSKPLEELTYAETRPDLKESAQSDQRPFCYIAAVHFLESDNLQEEWSDLENFAREQDQHSAPELARLTLSNLFKFEGNKFIANSSDFSKTMRTILVTNAGRGSYAFTKEEDGTPIDALRSLLYLEHRYRLDRLTPVYEVEEFLLRFIARNICDLEDVFSLELTYDVAKASFPLYLFERLRFNGYFGEDEYREYLSSMMRELNL